MTWDNIPREYCFSVSDFRSFEQCFFGFLVKHHLQKKYEVEEGSFNQTVGNILDLLIKKIHAAKAYDQPLDYLLGPMLKAAVNDLKEQAESAGPESFYGTSLKFLDSTVEAKVQQVFKNYYHKRKGKINRSIFYKKFWQCVLERYKVWGGPDALELGDDGIPEIVDYKYFSDPKKGKEGLDMDLMPKIYTLLCAPELLSLGYKKARFRIRSWTDPLDEGIYEEFDLELIAGVKDYLKLKIDKILSVSELNFCEKPYCLACNSKFREEWIKELQVRFNIS